MAVDEKVLEKKQLVGEIVESVTSKGATALQEFRNLNQAMVDKIVKDMAFVALENHPLLAKMPLKKQKEGFTRIRSQKICLQQR